MSRALRRMFIVLAVVAVVVAVVVVGGGVALYLSLPSIAMASMTPKEAFDAAKTPRVPDYKNDDAWLALPERKDEADVELYAMPAWTGPGRPPADVFYVHSTSSVAPQWNAAVDDAEVRKASIRGGTLIQASVFNACCAVYAPEYRQASGMAFVDDTADGNAAKDVAYADVVAAFVDFERRTGGAARPFIIAGHSQGSVLLTRLVREMVATDPARRARMVAAYLIGAPVVEKDLGGLHACHTQTETGCVVTYNARAPSFETNKLDFGGAVAESSRVCVNPVLGTDAQELAPREQHGGTVFFDALDTPKLEPHMLASQCKSGRLVVSDLQSLPKRDLPSEILLTIMGGKNYHPIEYQLFYVDLRNDAARRVAALARAAATAADVNAPR